MIKSKVMDFKAVMMTLCLALMSFTLTAQVTVTGTVTETTGDPVIGATVREKGTNSGTITDMNGEFSLKVANNKATLIVSYVGLETQEVKLAGKTKIDVELKSNDELLDEVVVVGYGVQKKSDLAGSSSSLSESVLKSAPITNLDQSFAGRVTGVTAVQTSGAPGSSSSIRVRGQATINAGAEPLYVIDGVIVQSGGTSGASYGLGDKLVCADAAGGDDGALVADEAGYLEAPVLQRLGDSHQIDPDLGVSPAATLQGDDAGVGCGECGDELPGHQFAEEDPASLFFAEPLASGILVDLRPESFDSFGDFREADARLEVYAEGHFGAVDQRLDGLAAELEPNRALNATVREVDVTEFVAGFGAFDIERGPDVLELYPAELVAELCPRRAAVNMEFEFAYNTFRILVSFRHQSREGGECRHYRMSHLLSPSISVTGASGPGITQSSGGNYQLAAQILPSVRRAYLEAPGPIFLRLDLRDFEFGLDLDSDGKTRVHERVDDVGGMVGARVSPVTPFDHGFAPEPLEEVYDFLRRKAVECRFDEVGLAADMAGEFVPRLHIREIAAALAGDHYLPPRARHFLKDSDLNVQSCVHGRPCGTVCRHQPGRARSDYDYI